MTASFPTSLKTYTDKTDFVDLVQAAHVNSLQDEVEAIEAELGTNPSAGYSTVGARFVAVETSAFELSFTFGDGVAVIGTTNIAGVCMPFAGTITSWKIRELGGTSGTITFNLKKAAYGGAFSDIDGSEPALLSGASENQDTSVTYTAFAVGDWVVCESTGTPALVKVVTVSYKGNKA